MQDALSGETRTLSSANWRKACWWLGRMLHSIHMPFAIGAMILGPLWLPLWLYGPMMIVIVGLQALTLGCPLMLVASWLMARYEPQPPANFGSFVYVLYQRLGRKIAIPLTILTFGLSTGLVWLYSGLFGYHMF
jgi:hypothetical protein